MTFFVFVGFISDWLLFFGSCSSDRAFFGFFDSGDPFGDFLARHAHTISHIHMQETHHNKIPPYTKNAKGDIHTFDCMIMEGRRKDFSFLSIYIFF
ncbi:hypothetical protein VTJ04DRAFT_8956 [Mycothermus thermophilus]|uniref:uncharacterized protein n=1 Tax=Humicola insolens TaxID=85995 RepID=UPI003743E4F8